MLGRAAPLCLVGAAQVCLLRLVGGRRADAHLEDEREALEGLSREVRVVLAGIGVAYEYPQVEPSFLGAHEHGTLEPRASGEHAVEIVLGMLRHGARLDSLSHNLFFCHGALLRAITALRFW